MEKQVRENFRRRFGREPAHVARAPGRIEFIGNHTDYNGGTVLGAAIDRGVWVALAPRADRQWNFCSADRLGVILPAGSAAKQEGEKGWVNYPLGVLAALPVFALPVPGGFDYFADSDLPAGAGLSSSAAIELSSALAFLALSGGHVEKSELAALGRHAENKFVGVPSGILDQGVSAFGERGKLVFIDCARPRFTTVPLPPAGHFWIFNTHSKHALVDGLYAARHRECMAAADELGVKQLVDVTRDLWEQRAGGVEPVARKRAQHVVEEIARVDATVEALAREDLVAVGKLLTASHRSSQRLFENSTVELDALVDALTESPHVFGARLTGGGFGGAVLALTDENFGAADAGRVAAIYRDKFKAEVTILHARTGDGAALVL